MSKDGVIDFGHRLFTSHEFLLLLQSSASQADRGFAAGNNYDCYGRFLASLCRRHFWPSARVTYYFEPNLLADEAAWMRKLIGRMENATGMRFREIRYSTGVAAAHWLGVSNYLKIYKSYGSVPGHASVGKVAWSYMTLNSRELQQENESLFYHEMGHVVGLLHAHQRYDRGNYITLSGREIQQDQVNYGAIPRTNCYWVLWWQNCYSNSTNYGTHYDYQSIMHYPSLPGATITAKNTGDVWDVYDYNLDRWGAMNGSTYFSPWDIYTIKSLYSISPNASPPYRPHPSLSSPP